MVTLGGKVDICLFPCVIQLPLQTVWNDSVFAHYSWAHVAILITAAWQFFMRRRAGAGRSCPSICSFWPWALPSNISPDFLFHNNKQCRNTKKKKKNILSMETSVLYWQKRGWPILAWQDNSPMNSNHLLHLCPSSICTQGGTTQRLFFAKKNKETKKPACIEKHHWNDLYM